MTPQTRWPEAARMFALDSQHHTLTVLRDDHLYRHLRFRDPGTSLYWYDLITWPGGLLFDGDYGTWAFRREPDMLAWFADDRSPDINPGYWAEKVTAGQATGYDPDVAGRLVTAAFDDWASDNGWPLASTAECWEAVADDVLAHVEDEAEIRTRLADFTYPFSGSLDAPRLKFTDTWEWDLSGFRFQFLWACFAIRHGVNRYRAHRIETADASAVATFPAPATPPVPRRQQQQLARRGGPSVVATPREQYL